MSAGSASGRGGHHSATGPNAHTSPDVANTVHGTAPKPGGYEFPRLDGMPEGTPDTFADFFAADADRLISDRAATGEPFTADDVWTDGLGQPRHPNEMGLAFQLAARHGVIVRCGWYRPSMRAGRNGSALAVWRGVAGR